MSRVEVIGNATLYLADCRDVLPTLEDVGAVIADPPYGMNYRSGHNTARTGVGQTMTRKDGNFKPIKGDQVPFDPSHLLTDVPTILWGANYYASRLPDSGCWLIWDKLAGKTPVPSGADIEMAWTRGVRSPSRIFTHLWRGIMRAGEENVSNGGKLHPNQKPVALMNWCLDFVPEAKHIADPYMGSASLGVACVRRGLAYTGIDNDPAHFDTACRRIEDAQRQSRMFA